MSASRKGKTTEADLPEPVSPSASVCRARISRGTSPAGGYSAAHCGIVSPGVAAARAGGLPGAPTGGVDETEDASDGRRDREFATTERPVERRKRRPVVLAKRTANGTVEQAGESARPPRAEPSAGSRCRALRARRGTR